MAELRARGIGRASTVVDLGAGTGAFARALAPHVARVIAVDVSEAMVVAMLDQGVEAVRGGFLGYEHEGKPPDAVFTRNGLHHLPAFWKAAALERTARCFDRMHTDAEGNCVAESTAYESEQEAARTPHEIPRASLWMVPCFDFGLL